MSDWQVGDLALCVRTSSLMSGGYTSIGGNLLRQGAIYTVTAMSANENSGLLDLTLAEVRSGTATGGFNSLRFRKVTPPAADEFDRETIELMNRVGGPVQ